MFLVSLIDTFNVMSTWGAINNIQTYSITMNLKQKKVNVIVGILR